MDLRIYASVGTGGAAGALARAGMAHALGNGAWPWATWCTNLFGCLAIGVALVWLVERPLQAGIARPIWLRPLIVTGFLGGFTTFSTFADELRGMAPGTALAYAISSLVLGVLAVAAGRAAARRAWNVGSASGAEDLAAEEDA